MMNDMQSGVLSITLTPANREKFQLGSKGKTLLIIEYLKLYN